VLGLRPKQPEANLYLGLTLIENGPFDLATQRLEVFRT